MSKELIKSCLKKEKLDNETIKEVLKCESKKDIKECLKNQKVDKEKRKRILDCVDKTTETSKSKGVSQTVNVYVQGGKSSKRSNRVATKKPQPQPQIQQPQIQQQYKGYASDLFDNKTDIYGQLEQRKKMSDLLFKMEQAKSRGEDVSTILARTLLAQQVKSNLPFAKSNLPFAKSITKSVDLPVSDLSSRKLLGELVESTIVDDIEIEGGADVANPTPSFEAPSFAGGSSSGLVDEPQEEIVESKPKLKAGEKPEEEEEEEDEEDNPDPTAPIRNRGRPLGSTVLAFSPLYLQNVNSVTEMTEKMTDEDIANIKKYVISEFIKSGISLNGIKMNTIYPYIFNKRNTKSPLKNAVNEYKRKRIISV